MTAPSRNDLTMREAGAVIDALERDAAVAREDGYLESEAAR